MQLGPEKPDAASIGSVLQAATLAPSSHNTQPWRFRVDGSRVALYADRMRRLPVNDPDDRELTISCGCALLNLRVAAAKAGIAASVTVLPDPGDKDLLAVVDLGAQGEVAEVDADLSSAISGRRTHRKPFSQKTVTDFLFQPLVDAAGQEDAWLEVITAEEARQNIAALVAEGDAEQWADPRWRRELAAWLRARRRGDGLAVPALAAPVARTVVRTFDMGTKVAAADRRLAEEAPALAVLGTGGDETADWVRAGQALERLLLVACRHGLQASYLNQPVQVDRLRSRLAGILASPGSPQILLRLGFPEKGLPAAPRRDLRDVVAWADEPEV